MKEAKRFFIPRLVLIGVGLIGGSLAQALRGKQTVGEVIGIGRSIENLEAAKSLGVIDHYTDDFESALRKADMLVIATPVGSFESILNRALPYLGPDTIVTDVGSIKGEIIDAARRVLGPRINQFVPVHPIAGSEKSGVVAAFAELFVDHKVVITPLAETSAKAQRTVECMWALTGAKIVQMEVGLHDRVLGVTSHLPHVVAYALMDYLSQQANRSEHYQFAAGGLFDTTRIASSDAVMWRDICLNNKENISAIINEYAETLIKLADQISAGKGDEIEQTFSKAKATREVLSRSRENT